MTYFARYTVIIERQLGDDDGQHSGYHDGTAVKAAQQVAKELQEAMDLAGIPVGEFQIVARQVVDEHAIPLHEMGPENELNVVNFQDDPS